MATYSKPPNAPNPILPSRFRLMSDTTGAAVVNGWNSASDPCATFSQGTTSSAANVTSIITPPDACTHLPTDNPRIASQTSAPKIAALTSRMNHLLPVSHATPGPATYSRYCVAWMPVSDVLRIAKSHRFQATRNPTSSLNPSFAH